jgi:ketosteroid isomerase-like protein
MESRAVGFGFRPCVWRDHVARGGAQDRQALERFFGQLKTYSLVPEDFETAETGDIGLAWGTFLEQWQEKDRPPEQARVRFSKVLTREAQGWQVLLYHRGIQPFAADGRYPKALTVLSPDS